MAFTLFNTGQKAIAANSLEGLNIRNVPVLDIEIISPQNSSEIHKTLEKNPIIVFQSKNGVAGFSRWLDSQNITSPGFESIFSTGTKTAQFVQKYLNLQSIVPEVQNASGLLSLFNGREKHPVLIITGAIYRKELMDGLENDGWSITHAIVYNTLPSVNRELKSGFGNSTNEILLFTSPSTVEGFLLSTGLEDLGEVNAKILSIGPTTSKWIRERSGTVYVEAPVPDISEALATVLLKLKKISQVKL